MIKLIFPIFFILIFSCTNKKINEIEPFKDLDSLYGKYYGITDDGRTLYLDITTSDSTDFQVNSLLGITVPRIIINGTLEGNELHFEDYRCIRCKRFGTYQKYSTVLSAYGRRYPENDSIVLFLDYQQNVFLPSYNGNLYLKKILDLSPIKPKEQFHGKYIGHTDDGREIFFSMIPSEKEGFDFKLENTIGLTYPGYRLHGKIEGNHLIFEDYQYNGDSRTRFNVSRKINANGQWFPKTDSAIIFIDSDQQELEGIEPYIGNFYIKKIE